MIGMLKKYEKIKQDISEKIISNVYQVNDKLPTETELMKNHGVSRFTVRRALDELEKENFVYSIQGGGTFVNNWQYNQQHKTKNSTIGVVSTYITSYIFSNIIQGIDNYISSYGYSILIASTQNNPDKERQGLNNLLSNDLSGLIIEPTKSGEENINKNIYENIKAMGMPMLSINSTYDLNIPHLVMDDVKSGELITDYLISRGHEQIVGIFKVDDKQGIDRMNGFIKAYRHRPEISNLNDIMMYQTEENKKNLFYKLHSLLKRKEFIPSAIVCYNDELAIQVISFVKKLGLNVPYDVSIISIDDYQMSKYINPELTTIRHPQENMGVDAGKMILNMIKQKPVESIVYPPYLIERNSVIVKNQTKDSV